MYRERNLANNTLSSLLRGTAGTAAAAHAAGSLVYSLGRGNLLQEEYQNYIVNNTFLADGATTQFTTDFSVSSPDIGAVEVYVGGTRILSGAEISNLDPVIVDFDEPPPEGVQINVLVRRGVTWYAPGPGTPSNGVALQDTNTPAARFLRGLI